MVIAKIPSLQEFFKSHEEFLSWDKPQNWIQLPESSSIAKETLMVLSLILEDLLGGRFFAAGKAQRS